MSLLLSMVLASSLVLPGGSSSPFDDCESEYARDRVAMASAECFYLVASREKRWEEASERLRRLLDEAPGNDWLRYFLGNVHWFIDREQAVDWYRAAADGFAASGQETGEVMARGNLRTLLRQDGRVLDAELQVERVMEVARGSDDPLVISRAYIQQAEHLWELSDDLGRADRLLRHVETLLFPSGPYFLQKICLLSSGNVALELGQLERAVQYYRRLGALAQNAEDRWFLAVAQHNLANARRLQLEESPREVARKAVLRDAAQALEISAEVGHPFTEPMSHRLLGALLTSDDEAKEEARSHFERCIELTRANDMRQEMGNCLWEFSRMLERDDPERARVVADEALNIALDFDDATYVAFAWRQRMRVGWRGGGDRRALADSMSALDAVERLRDLQISEHHRTELFSRWTADYYFVSGRLLQAGDSTRALSVIERMRARALLESVSRTRSEGGVGPEQPSYGKRQETLRRLVTLQRELLNRNMGGSARGEALARLERLELDYDELNERVLREGGEPTAALAFASVNGLRQELSPHEAILSFQVGLWKNLYGEFGGGSWVIVITREGERAIRLPDRTAIESAVTVFLGLFDRRDGSENVLAGTLHDMLLNEALDALPAEVNRLVIIPDDVLHRLPFGALYDAERRAHLATRFEISILPSATLWLEWRKAVKPHLRPSALAFADPALSISSGGGQEVERDWPGTSGELLRDLPYARREGRSLKRGFGRRSALFLSSEASEKRLKTTALDDYGLIHFATHSVVDELQPHRSAILLAPGSEEEDGLLQLREIADLRLNGQVIGLSACQTADGNVFRGEGILSLARGFFRAGARSVVASLWPLRDDEAARMFEAFYRHVAAGKTVGAALQYTQSEAIEQGMPAAAWASLVLLGDPDSRPVPDDIESRSAPWAARWAFGVVVLLAVVSLLRARARAR